MKLYFLYITCTNLSENILQTTVTVLFAMKESKSLYWDGNHGTESTTNGTHVEPPQKGHILLKRSLAPFRFFSYF